MAKQSCQPTPLTDGKHLWYTRPPGTACLDLAGKCSGRNTELRYNPVHGAGGTPIASTTARRSVDGDDKQVVVARLRHGQGNLEADRKWTAEKNSRLGTAA